MSSPILFAGHLRARDFLNLINYPEVEENIYKLEGVVSRKKQLLPFLTHCLKQLK